MSGTNIDYPPILDGFVHSASMLYLSTTYRASALAQMEVLRRAKGYRCRHYLVPDADDNENPIGPFSQIERQINTLPGSYLWGICFSAPSSLNDSLEVGSINGDVHVQITDACTETPIFSDYVYSYQIACASPANGSQNRRNPFILAQPALIGEPGLIDVEIYNRLVDTATPPVGQSLTCQVVLMVAEPCVPPEQMRQLLMQSGLYEGMVI